MAKPANAPISKRLRCNSSFDKCVRHPALVMAASLRFLMTPHTAVTIRAITYKLNIATKAITILRTLLSGKSAIKPTAIANVMPFYTCIHAHACCFISCCFENRQNRSHVMLDILCAERHQENANKSIVGEAIFSQAKRLNAVRYHQRTSIGLSQYSWWQKKFSRERDFICLY